jgi:hypothetical protein
MTGDIREFRINGWLLVLPVIGMFTGCAPGDPPGQRQLACARVARSDDSDGRRIFLLDLGRRTVTGLDGPNHLPTALEFDDYTYRFSDAGGASVTIGRHDGAMVLRRWLQTGKVREARNEDWACRAQKRGTIV